MSSTDYCTLNSPCQNGGNCSLVSSNIFHAIIIYIKIENLSIINYLI